ncbi:hypothetical protein XAP3CFBP6996_018825 [Xanthomonas citri pv. fuscans CFBP 6996]|uniref:Uncharacterized protein n=1 Tax=Xanthomonas citri pv. phaseoli var. fuscans TaxID=473423 RepID=A0AB33FDJ8_XANCI|nr:hypothetical protein XcvCFBP7112P_12440 [Xanthomonas citri pv. vignicola]ASL00728.1 hypothetical protein XcvCFBP7113P_10420 [Xanthomonas citri pv. vignicola]PTY29729.1 hypothetical protein XAP3CFBP6996_018825 [Xanthomonas citri pv. fuscans CFBP 6996]QWN16638.1 hypothetical protein DGN02_13075 [Xanthomonas citri]QWN20838.1 hypothetical protein DGM98_12525 [Xanthomonas citri]
MYVSDWQKSDQGAISATFWRFWLRPGSIATGPAAIVGAPSTGSPAVIRRDRKTCRSAYITNVSATARPSLFVYARDRSTAQFAATCICSTREPCKTRVIRSALRC